MGLSNASTTFDDVIRRILDDLVDVCQSYFDDIYVVTRSKSLEDHLEALDRVFARLNDHKCFVKLSKCVFCADTIPFGHFHRPGMNCNHSWELQSTCKRCCQTFADDADPLFDMLKSKAQKLTWTATLRRHFEQLKHRIRQTPVLAIAELSKDFFIRMDASNFAMGGVLFQKEIKMAKQSNDR
ncbi:Reverse transcriptase-rnase h-integrase [Phytophthora palmivora]|uniref:Reverse transcriptase-rnase h-integrase n=1 Tax=Phytophthora palmivora TaxID=4796 RepID=A0A2P4XAY3_9STRA|nr:Reverse transcriptase-rnase h-integrase [Phytophthora palmivora]